MARLVVVESVLSAVVDAVLAEVEDVVPLSLEKGGGGPICPVDASAVDVPVAVVLASRSFTSCSRAVIKVDAEALVSSVEVALDVDEEARFGVASLDVLASAVLSQGGGGGHPVIAEVPSADTSPLVLAEYPVELLPVPDCPLMSDCSCSSTAIRSVDSVEPLLVREVLPVEEVSEVETVLVLVVASDDVDLVLLVPPTDRSQ